MGHLFISYSRKDASGVRKIVGRLQRAGFDVWVDEAGLQGGDQWRARITQALEGAESFLLVLSRNSVASDEVRREVDIAVDTKIPIIPLILEPARIPDSLQYQLAGVQRVDLTEGKSGFDKLVNALGGPRSVKRVRANWARGALFGLMVGTAVSLGVGLADHQDHVEQNGWWRELLAFGHLFDQGVHPGSRLLLFCALATFFGAVTRVRWRLHNGALIGVLLGALWLGAGHLSMLDSRLEKMENTLFPAGVSAQLPQVNALSFWPDADAARTHVASIRELLAKPQGTGPLLELDIEALYGELDLLESVFAKSADLTTTHSVAGSTPDASGQRSKPSVVEASKQIGMATLSGGIMGLTAGWLVTVLLQLLGRLATGSAAAARWVAGE